jgi:hypothetical protein
MHWYIQALYPEDGGGKVEVKTRFLDFSDSSASEQFRQACHSKERPIGEAALYRARGGKVLIEHYQPYM